MEVESKAGETRVLIFASGDEKGGGSHFQELVEFSRTTLPSLTHKSLQSSPIIITEESAKKPTPFVFPLNIGPDPITEKVTETFVEKFQADFVMCSGWLKFVRGLDPAKTVNIHPGPCRGLADRECTAITYTKQ